MKDKLIIGKIIKPQGIKGEVKLKILTDNPQIFLSLKDVFIDDKPKKVLSCSVRFGFAYLMLEGITSRNDAEKLRDKEVSILKSDFVLEENTFLIEDILNCEVFDEKNNYIGKLVNIEKYGAADVWTIYADGRNYQIPYINKIVKNVLINEKKIIFNRKNFNEAKICE